MQLCTHSGERKGSPADWLQSRHAPHLGRLEHWRTQSWRRVTHLKSLRQFHAPALQLAQLDESRIAQLHTLATLQVSWCRSPATRI